MLAVIRTSPESFGMVVWRELEDVTGRDIATARPVVPRSGCVPASVTR